MRGFLLPLAHKFHRRQHHSHKPTACLSSHPSALALALQRRKLISDLVPLGFMRCYSFQCLGGTSVPEIAKIGEESLEFAHAPVYYPLTDPICTGVWALSAHALWSSTTWRYTYLHCQIKESWCGYNWFNSPLSRPLKLYGLPIRNIYTSFKFLLDL